MSDTDFGNPAAPPLRCLEFRIPVSAGPDRLDKVLAQLVPQHSRTRLQTWIEGGHVRVNDAPATVRQIVYPGDRLAVHEQRAPEDLAFAAEPVEFAVVAQGPDWIVVDKPAGLVTHPGAGNWGGTLLNGLLHRFPELRHVPRAGIVHRLDKDTSGLLVIARNETAQTDFVRQLQARSMRREYVALVQGHVAAGGVVREEIGRDPRVPVRMTTVHPLAPKPAVTHYQPRRRGHAGAGQPVTQLDCRLQTGRTHQIRVHLSSLGHPLVGDALYGGRLLGGAQRQLLHARSLGFDEPGSGRRLDFEAILPEDFEQVLEGVAWTS